MESAFSPPLSLVCARRVPDCLAAALARHARGVARPDGMLIVLPNESGSDDALASLGIPSVVCDIPSERNGAPSQTVSFVRLDDEAIGYAAADHLLSRGKFNSFLCVNDQPQFLYPALRLEGFRRRLKRNGLSADCLVIPENLADTAEIRRVRDALAALPSPAAVFAVRDHAAVKILRVCQRFSLPVPERIAVLGVDNDELLCTSTKTALSSVMPDHEQVGFAAAKELDRLMRGGAGRELVFPESVKGVALRTSTRIVPPAARVISDALAFIEQNASGSLRVADVARHLGVSRRLADLRFQHVHDCTIHDAISSALFEKVTARLSAGDTPGEIARALSFSSPAALTRFFRSRTGQPPSAWVQ